MPPLGRYTMGMIRRSLAFPLRARNKAASGGRAGERPSWGWGLEGICAAATPWPPPAGTEPGDCGDLGGQPKKF